MGPQCYYDPIIPWDPNPIILYSITVLILFSYCLLSYYPMHQIERNCFCLHSQKLIAVHGNNSKPGEFLEVKSIRTTRSKVGHSSWDHFAIGITSRRCWNWPLVTWSIQWCNPLGLLISAWPNNDLFSKVFNNPSKSGSTSSIVISEFPLRATSIKPLVPHIGSYLMIAHHSLGSAPCGLDWKILWDHTIP